VLHAPEHSDSCDNNKILRRDITRSWKIKNPTNISKESVRENIAVGADIWDPSYLLQLVVPWTSSRTLISDTAGCRLRPEPDTFGVLDSVPHMAPDKRLLLRIQHVHANVVLRCVRLTPTPEAIAI
jgi:hypothetical protein